jgi:putative redox protein
MEMKVTFPGGKKVAAEFAGMTVVTDQAIASGGEESAPSPFDLFFASIATCAGFYVLTYCHDRGIATEGIELKQRAKFRVTEEKKPVLSTVEIDIALPPGFPDEHREGVVKAAEGCTVKKAIMAQPQFVVRGTAG